MILSGLRKVKNFLTSCSSHLPAIPQSVKNSFAHWWKKFSQAHWRNPEQTYENYLAEVQKTNPHANPGRITFLWRNLKKWATFKFYNLIMTTIVTGVGITIVYNEKYENAYTGNKHSLGFKLLQTYDALQILGTVFSIQGSRGPNNFKESFYESTPQTREETTGCWRYVYYIAFLANLISTIGNFLYNYLSAYTLREKASDNPYWDFLTLYVVFFNVWSFVNYAIKYGLGDLTKNLRQPNNHSWLGWKGIGFFLGSLGTFCYCANIYLNNVLGLGKLLNQSQLKHLGSQTGKSTIEKISFSYSIISLFSIASNRGIQLYWLCAPFEGRKNTIIHKPTNWFDWLALITAGSILAFFDGAAFAKSMFKGADEIQKSSFLLGDSLPALRYFIDTLATLAILGGHFAFSYSKVISNVQCLVDASRSIEDESSCEYKDLFDEIHDYDTENPVNSPTGYGAVDNRGVKHNSVQTPDPTNKSWWRTPSCFCRCFGRSDRYALANSQPISSQSKPKDTVWEDESEAASTDINCVIL